MDSFPGKYLDAFPMTHVGEIHLAGFAEQVDDEGDLLLIDSHDGPVADAVWELFDIVVARCGAVPTLVEWDSNIPDWPILKAEAAAAKAILDGHAVVFVPGKLMRGSERSDGKGGGLLRPPFIRHC